jgi:hypothetical protein
MQLEADLVLGQIALELDDPDVAGRLLARVADGFAAMGEDLLAAIASLALARIAVLRGDTARARQLMENAIAEHRRSATPILLAKALLEAAAAHAGSREACVAAALITEALELTRSGEFRQVELEAIEGLAWVLAVTGDASRAVRLLGAGESIREVSKGGMTPSRRKRLVETETAARESLGVEAFDAAFTAGKALGREQAAAEALALATERASHLR